MFVFCVPKLNKLFVIFTLIQTHFTCISMVQIAHLACCIKDGNRFQPEMIITFFDRKSKPHKLSSFVCIFNRINYLHAQTKHSREYKRKAHMASGDRTCGARANYVRVWKRMGAKCRMLIAGLEKAPARQQARGRATRPKLGAGTVCTGNTPDYTGMESALHNARRLSLVLDMIGVRSGASEEQAEEHSPMIENHRRTSSSCPHQAVPKRAWGGLAFAHQLDHVVSYNTIPSTSFSTASRK